MNNIEKYHKIKHLFYRLNNSIKNKYWYESVFLEYAYIENRLAAILCVLDVQIYGKDEQEYGIEKKIALLKARDEIIVKNHLPNEFLDELLTWKNQRNKLVHNLVLSTASDDIERIAKIGYELTKRLNNAATVIIRKYQKINDNRLYFMLCKDCYIRNVNGLGYIKKIGVFTDMTFDKSGNIFLAALERKPQKLEELSKRIAKKYKDVCAEDIQDDVKQFFDMLAENGYVVKGRNYSETILNNNGFSYSALDEKVINGDYTPEKNQSDFDTQTVLDKEFLKDPFLFNFQIELTSKCNERCIHCYIPHEYKNSDIKDELFYCALEQLEKMGTLCLTFSGGEPLLHPHFKEYLKAAKKKDFYVNVLSNLVNLDDDIVKECRKGNTCAFQASLYSLNPDHHDFITKLPGSCEKTKANILKLIENDIPVQVNCPVMKANKGDVYDVIMWCRDHKIRINTDYEIMAKYDHQTDNLANRLTPEECKGVIRDIIQADADYRESLYKFEYDENMAKTEFNPDEPFCGVGIDTCCMVANGNVYPCPGWQGYVCGNLNEDTLENIWNNSKAMNWVRNIRRGDMSQCSECSNRDFCSPCLSRFANESQDGNPLEVPSHFCDVAKVNKEVVLSWISEHKQ